ncbi:MAG: helix-turn-helix domain-containing protein [Opitutales bacterium]
MPDSSLTFDFTLLRMLRKRQNLTIEQVSARSGVSPGVVSKLERNQSVAELDTLYRIARVFGMSTADLLRMAESPFAHRAKATTDEAEGFRFRRVRYANALAMEVTAPVGAHLSRPEVHRNDLELCWVLEGELRIELPHETCELATGESLQFDAILEHTYEALSDCRFLLLHLRKEDRY